MTPFVESCLWCILQVTLVGLLTGLVLTAALAVLVVSPWPRWERSREVGAFPTFVQRMAAASRSAFSKHDERRPRLPRIISPKTPSTKDGSESPLGNDRSSGGEPQDAIFDEARVNGVATDAPTETHMPFNDIDGGDGEFMYGQSDDPVPTMGRGWSVYAAAFVAFAFIIGVLRFVIGWFAVRRQVVRSHVLSDCVLRELCTILRAELGCVRTVELRVSDELTTAATVGWRRPVILLPHAWGTWTDDERRAILAHELAHIRRNHFAAWLIAQAGLVAHFYHPLIHWLAARLRLEQEYEADALAARITGGRQSYLQTLARLALRQPDASLGWPARAFLPTRRTFLRRIEMLRQTQHSWKPSAVTRALAVTIILCGGAFAAGVRAPRKVTGHDPRGGEFGVLREPNGLKSEAAAIEPQPIDEDNDSPQQLQVAALDNPTPDDPDLKKAAQSKTAPPNAEQLKIANAIRACGGSYQLFDGASTWRLREVRLNGAVSPEHAIALLSQQPQMEKLHLDESQITDADLAELTALTGLLQLDLKDTQITDAGLTHLVSLQNLGVLDLSGTSVRGSGLDQLSDLPIAALRLERTKIDDESLRYLMPMNRLQRLDVSRTDVTLAGIQELWRVHPDLEVTEAKYLDPGDRAEAENLLRAVGDRAIAERTAVLLGDDSSPGREIRDAFKRRGDRVRGFRFQWKEKTVDDRGTANPEDDIVRAMAYRLAVDVRLCRKWETSRLFMATSSEKSPSQRVTIASPAGPSSTARLFDH